MAQAANNLQQLKGIGTVLAKRLAGAGITSFKDIMEAGEERLKTIAGIKNGSAAAIVEQARGFAEAKTADRAGRVEAVRGRVAAVRQTLTRIGDSARERFAQELEKKRGRRVTRDLEGVAELLDRLEGGEPKRLKRAERAMKKLERRMEGLDEATLGKVHKGLKKSKKALVKALS